MNIVRTISALTLLLFLGGCSTPNSSVWGPLWETASTDSKTNDIHKTCAVHTGHGSNNSHETLSLLTNAAFESHSEELKLEALKVYSHITANQYKQSHSIQLYRDASFALCQAYHSGMLSEPRAFSQSVSKLLTLLTHKANIEQLVDNDALLTPDSQQTFDQLQSELALTREQLLQVIADSSTHDAYLMAQLTITTMAFQSLDNEHQYNYNAEVRKLKVQAHGH
ncbi:hypothetical protein [Vibrio mediterranei]|uniref:Chromosome partitioning protein ParA n=1 Tax=Vibrio mediterranei TaxID=689 RepID=A0ABX5DMK8_9VIBR|nr:hypothetical protein [Vibrio mediterranei]PCD90189.1 hypothetical protein COR52_02690 [Vibrio mediterranei]PRQ69575.1 hypothetical protein COR51_02985 [Vibrio mediterranei]